MQNNVLEEYVWLNKSVLKYSSLVWNFDATYIFQSKISGSCILFGSAIWSSFRPPPNHVYCKVPPWDLLHDCPSLKRINHRPTSVCYCCWSCSRHDMFAGLINSNVYEYYCWTQHFAFCRSRWHSNISRVWQSRSQSKCVTLWERDFDLQCWRLKARVTKVISIYLSTNLFHK